MVRMVTIMGTESCPNWTQANPPTGFCGVTVTPRISFGREMNWQVLHLPARPSSLSDDQSTSTDWAYHYFPLFSLPSKIRKKGWSKEKSEWYMHFSKFMPPGSKKDPLKRKENQENDWSLRNRKTGMWWAFSFLRTHLGCWKWYLFINRNHVTLFKTILQVVSHVVYFI